MNPEDWEDELSGSLNIDWTLKELEDVPDDSTQKAIAGIIKAIQDAHASKKNNSLIAPKLRIGWEIEKKSTHTEMRAMIGGSNVLVLVARDGWDFSNERRNTQRKSRSTRGNNVRMSTNGVMALTGNDYLDMMMDISDMLNFELARTD